MYRPQPLAIFAFPNSIPKVPHLLKDLDPETKLSCKNFYRKVKKGIVIGSISGICIYEAGQLICDLVKSKLILRRYRKLLFLSIAPTLEVKSIIFYRCTNSTKAKLIAKTLSEVGLSLWRVQQEIVNVVFFVPDLILFGEPVSITDNSPLSIFQNETESNIDTTFTDN